MNWKWIWNYFPSIFRLNFVEVNYLRKIHYFVMFGEYIFVSFWNGNCFISISDSPKSPQMYSKEFVSTMLTGKTYENYFQASNTSNFYNQTHQEYICNSVLNKMHKISNFKVLAKLISQTSSLRVIQSWSCVWYFQRFAFNIVSTLTR